MESDKEGSYIVYLHLNIVMPSRTSYSKLKDANPNLEQFVKNDKLNRLRIIFPSLMFKSFSAQVESDGYSSITAYRMDLKSVPKNLVKDVAIESRNKLNLVFIFTPNGDKQVEFDVFYCQNKTNQFYYFKLEDLASVIEMM